ncbi:MAG: protein-export chaperone SecB [Gemmatimonadetes bacterium]|nr:protein-export chaperone SecB [Gemmatimonadota bacterium]
MSGPGAEGAAPVQVYLVEARFVDGSAAGEPVRWETVGLEIAADVRRPSPRTVTVALRVRADEGAPVVLDVRYACDFDVGDAVEGEAVDGVCRELALVTGPALLYPYVREEVSRLTERSRLGRLELPLLRPPLQALDEFSVPPPEGQGQEP